MTSEITEGVVNEIAAEARRQFEPEADGGEGYSAEHDDQHGGNLGLSRAAAAYAMLAWDERHATALWPWHDPIKPKSMRRNLVVAAALLVREIERLDRAAEGKPQ